MKIGMRSMLVAALGLTLLSGGLALSQNGSTGKAKSSESRTAGEGPSTPRIGLIDMGVVFQGYKKFTDLRAGLQKKIEESDAEAKGIVEEIKGLQQQLQQLSTGSPDYKRVEQELIDKNATFNSFKTKMQREFAREEAQIFKVVYLEVQDLVERYAKTNNYTLVMRFSRTKVEEAKEPGEVLQSMNNRQVVYFREEDDITEKVLYFLNKSAGAESGAPKKPSPTTKKTANP